MFDVVLRLALAAMNPPGNAVKTPIKPTDAWKVIRIVLPHLWPPNAPELRLRVLVGAVLLVAAKVTNVGVPVFYKHAVEQIRYRAA